MVPTLQNLKKQVKEGKIDVNNINPTNSLNLIIMDNYLGLRHTHTQTDLLLFDGAVHDMTTARLVGQQEVMKVMHRLRPFSYISSNLQAHHK